MNTDRFDDEIKRALESFEEEYDASSWDKLASALDDTPAADGSEIDPIIKEKLGTHKEPINESHWQEMHEELDLIDEKKDRLILTKTVELLTILLLALTIQNYVVDPTEPLAPMHYAMQSSAIDTDESHDDVNGEVVIANVTNEESKARSPLSLITTVQSQAIAETEEESIVSNDIVSSHVINTDNELSAGDNPIAVLTKEKEAVERVTTLDNRSINELAYDEPSADMQYVATEPIKVESQDEFGRWSIELPFSRDINVINSSFGLIDFGRRIRSGVYGTSVGLLASYGLNDYISIVSGVNYSKKTHTPGLIRNFAKASSGSYLETQLDRIDFSQVQVPVLVRINGRGTGRSGIYSIAGLGMNFITDYSYEVKKSVQPSARLTSLDLSKNVDLSDMPEGLSRGGALDDNYYTTVFVGIGYQLMLKNSASIYVQPQYQFTLSEGANRYVRKVNTFNMQAGIRFNFGK